MEMLSPGSPADAGIPGHSKWTAAVLVSAGIFIALLDTTIVDIILPKMMVTMEADIYDIQWVVITYFLGAAIAMTVVGWISRRADLRNAYLAGVFLFTAMSAAAGLSLNLSMMLVARFLQGAAEGLMVPLGLIILYRSFPVSERGLAMGIYGLSASFAPALGPSLGGFLAEYLNWRWVFFINLPVGLLDAALIYFLMGKIAPEEKSGGFDVTGFLFLSVSLSSLIVILGKGQEKGWFHSDLIFYLFLVFLVSTAGTVLRFAYGSNPLFPRRIFRSVPFCLGMAVAVLISMNAYGFFFLIPMYLQKLHGYTTFQSGMILLPGAVLAAGTTLLSGILSDKMNPKIIAFVFMLGSAAASWFYCSDMDAPRALVIRDYIYWGALVDGTFAPVMLMAMAALREDDIPNGSTILNVIRLVSGSIGTAFATSILTMRKDGFFESLSMNLTVGGIGKVEPATRLRFENPGDYFNPDTWTRLASVCHDLIAARAGSFAFHAAFEYLAIIMAIAVPITMFMEYKRPGKATEKA